MMWQTILKTDKTGTHGGKDVTQMYHFLKRYFGNEQTNQFKKIYILYDELSDQDKRSLYQPLNRLFKWGNDAQMMDNSVGRPMTPGLWYPGINIFTLTKEKINITFNDSLHVKDRDVWIRKSEEANKSGRRRTYWGVKQLGEPPKDEKIQQEWQTMERIIKKSKNYRFTLQWGGYGSSNY